jgi:hypothetical protein
MQQVMKNNEETYLSLFEYLGKGSGGSNIGREVTAEAVKQGIELKWKMLPKDMQKPEYTQVHLYPLSFLDEYFATKAEVDATPIVRRSALIEIESRLNKLETQINEFATAAYEEHLKPEVDAFGLPGFVTDKASAKAIDIISSQLKKKYTSKVS